MPSAFAGDPTVFPATYLIPSDGDDRDAASVNVALEALGDRTAWLKARVSDFFEYTNSANSGGDPTSQETFSYGTIGSTWTKSTIIKVDITGCKAFDILQCRLHIGAVNLSSTNPASHLTSLRMYVTDDLGGGSETDFVVSGSHGMIDDDGTTNGTDIYHSYASHGRHGVSFDGTCRVGFEVRLRSSATGMQAVLYSGIHLEVRRIQA